MIQKQEKKMTLVASLDKNCATLRNMQGMKWKFENCKHLQSAIAVMVSETLWNQFDVIRSVSAKFELTLTIKLKDN